MITPIIFFAVAFYLWWYLELMKKNDNQNDL